MVVDKDTIKILTRSPTEVELESGVYKLKFISTKDAQFIFKLLYREDDAETFTKLMLHNQLIEPDISYEDFEVISDDEIKALAREFIKDEYKLAEYFKETTEAEFFKNFRKAVKDYLFGITEAISESMKNISSFVNNYAFSIRPIDIAALTPPPINLTPLIQLGKVPQINYSEIISRPAIDFTSIYGALNQLQSTAINLSQIIAPQIDLWTDWVRKNSLMFNDFVEHWKEFEEKFEIQQGVAKNCLKKYRWFMTPSLPVDFIYSAIQICKNGGNQRRVVNHLFIRYFTSNDYEELIKLVEDWKSNKLFKRRMKILRDCVNTLRETSPKVNASNLVIPTLISQIDGIQKEFMKSKGIVFKKKGGLKGADGHGVKWRDWYENLIDEGEFLDSANDIFLNILFQDTDDQKLKTPYTFSRHKIMHGEQIRYGRKDNVIRAFLILDFLASLMDD